MTNTKVTKSIGSAVLGGAALMVGAGAIFALSNTLVQYLTMMRGADSSVVAFVQYACAAVLFLPWIIAQGRQGWRTDRWGEHLIRVALSAAGVWFWVTGLAHVPIWQAIALIMLSPIFVTLGAGLLLREDVDALRWVAVIAGAVGGAIVLAPWSDAFSLYALMPVAAAAFWAAVSLMTKRMTATESPETLTLWMLVGTVPFFFAMMMRAGTPVMPSDDILLMIAGGGALIALAQWMLARAYTISDAGFLQPFDHVKLLFNVGLGAVAFNFLPPGRLWLGAALIVGASMLLLARDRDR